jgi:predicted AlkP superfamily phosphohydrolase/phosphomutase
MTNQGGDGHDSAGGAGRSGSRTVVLGFDALSLEYLDAFDLPNFETLRGRGVCQPLPSSFPPWTGSAWPSMYTGMDPGHHGVYSFFDFDGRYPGGADLVSRNDVDAPALWNYLSTTGLESAVLNVPVTHPAEPVDGVLVPGYLAPEGAAGHPDGIREQLSAALGETYRIYASREVGEADDAMLRSYVDLIGLRARAARTLLETRDPDVAVFQVQKTDTVFHQFDDTAAHRRVYEAADAFLGTVLDAAGPDANVVVCSDHGIGPARGYNVYVNEILRRAGLVEATPDGQTPTLGESKHQLAGGSGASTSERGLSRRAVSGVASALATVGIQPGDVYAAASRVGAGEALRRVLPDAGSLVQHVDWAASRAYCRSGPELGVRLNLAGREPAGQVPPGEYEAVRERVIALLRGVETPDGEPAFDWVRPREAVYDGPHVDSACDVLVRPAGENHIVATSLVGTDFVPVDKYTHKSEGVFLAAGPDFASTDPIAGLSLPDVAPIVMALSGCAVPERMTGAVPEGLLRSPVETRAYDVPRYGSGTVADGDDRVEARLADLGYL